MMREILYQGKTNTGEWLQGLPVLSASTGLWWIRGSKTERLVLPDTIGQYTGWNDKNETPLFEGDKIHVVLFDRFGKQIASGAAVVEFRKGVFGFEWGHRKEFTRFDGFCNTTFEKVGNIHDTEDTGNVTDNLQGVFKTVGAG